MGGGAFSRFREVERLEQISSVLIKHELGYILTRIGMRQGHKKRKELRPEALVKICGELGGTFVKLGQFLSLRPDLLPTTYNEAFSKLQDDVPAFPGKEAKTIIAQQLGAPLSKVFDHVDEKPLAAASIGQVHRAKLATGEHVAIKVLRPGIKELVTTDLLLLYRFATLIQRHFEPEVFDPLLIVEEFRRYTEEELNYLGEMQALKTCAENFKLIKRVRIPKPYEQWCTEHVLTMEFLPGKSLHASKKSLSKERRRELCDELTHVVLKQVFIDGYFHADLHPGNILLMPRKQLGLIDFGIMGRVDEHTREYLTILLLSLVDKDLDGVVKAMAKLHFFTGQEDERRLKEGLAAALGPYYGVSVEKMDIAAMFLEALRVARDNHLHVPEDLVLLGKTVVTLKGLVEDLDPSFDTLSVIKPFISELLKRQASLDSIMKKATKDAIRLKSFVTDLPRLTEEYFATTTQVERDLRQIGYQIQTFSTDMALLLRQAFVLLFLVVFSSVSVLSWNIGPRILGVSALSLLSGGIAAILFLLFIKSFFRLKL